MKKSLLLSISVLFILTQSLILSCSIEEDPDETPIYRIENNTLVSIENNQNQFNVGDVIFIETLITPSQTTTTNQNINLTDYIYEPENGPLWYSLTLYRENSLGSLIRVPVGENNIVQDLGTANTNDNSQYPTIQVQSFFDGNTFYSRFGISLTETGNYLINSENLNNAFISVLGGDFNLGYINIKSKIVNSDDAGFYQFTVN